MVLGEAKLPSVLILVMLVFLFLLSLKVSGAWGGRAESRENDPSGVPQMLFLWVWYAQPLYDSVNLLPMNQNSDKETFPREWCCVDSIHS